MAIARLDGWKWLVNTRGYANVVHCEDQVDGDENFVYGVLYSMSKEDEGRLDVHEGVDYSAPDALDETITSREVRPKEQECGAYNKWYLPVGITTWVDTGFQSACHGAHVLTALVYVDEFRVSEGLPREEYVGRMNRGIEEAVALGLPRGWVENVVRTHIPKRDRPSLPN